MPVIAAQGDGAYMGRMGHTILRLLALCSLVLMPLGMAQASAPVGVVAAPNASSHCDGDGEDHSVPVEQAEKQCMACAGLFTAIASTAEPLLPRAPRQLALMREFHGIVLEIATPPPKAS